MVHLYFLKLIFESQRNMAVGAAILCLTVCGCGVVNKASMCGRSTSWANLFLLFFGKEYNSMATPWGAEIESKRVHVLHEY